MSSRREKSDSESSPESDGEGGNAFANDGSFLEMFKRRMEEQKCQEKAKSEAGAGPVITGKIVTTKTTTSTAKPALSSATDVPKAAVNKPYQVVQYFTMFTQTADTFVCSYATECPSSLLHITPFFLSLITLLSKVPLNDIY